MFLYINFVVDEAVGDSTVVDLTNNWEEDCEAKVGCYLEGPKLYSVDAEYMPASTISGPGDLVIAMLSEINRPARFDAEFGNGFLILGAVIGFKCVDMNTVEALKKGVSWEAFTKKKRLFVD